MIAAAIARPAFRGGSLRGVSPLSIALDSVMSLPAKN